MAVKVVVKNAVGTSGLETLEYPEAGFLEDGTNGLKVKTSGNVTVAIIPWQYLVRAEVNKST